MKRTLQTRQKTLGIRAGAVSVGYSGLACRLSGCGSLQRLEFTRSSF
jgi:hypothetical protein